MRRLCAIAGVSRCGYYKYLQSNSGKDVEDKKINSLIVEIQEKYHFSIGYRKMIALLEKETSKRYGTKRIRRIMKRNNLQSVVRAKKYSDEVYIRRRKLREDLPQDLINRNFFALEPYRRFVEDITYLPCLEQTLYLNTIEDLFNGEIHAYSLSNTVDTKLCLDTVNILI